MIGTLLRLALALPLAALLAGGLSPVARAAVSAPEPASKERVDYLEKRLEDSKGEQDKLESRLNERLKQTEERVKGDIEKQDSRISDLQVILGTEANVAQWTGIIVSVMEILLLLTGAIAGYLGFQKLKSDAEKEIENAKKLIQADGARILRELRRVLVAAKKDGNAITNIREQAQKNSGTAFGSEGSSVPELDEAALANSNLTLQTYEDRPPKDMSYKDWMSKGFLASEKNDFVDAASSFVRAAKMPAIAARDQAVAWGMASIAYSNLKAYAAAIDCCDKVIAVSSQPDLEEYASRAIFNKGVILRKSNNPTAAIASYDEHIERFSDSSDHVVQEHFAKALNNKGFLLEDLKKNDEAIICYNQLLDRFGSSKDAAFYEPIAIALINKGIVLGQMNKPQEEIACYNDALARFRDEAAPALKEQVAKALVNKGVAFGELDEPDEAIACYNEVLARFKDETASALKEQVARALVNKGVTLGGLGKPEEEIASYEDVVKRFKGEPDPALKELVAMALVNMGVVLGEQGRHREEIACYDDVLARFKDETAPVLMEQVANAEHNKRIALGKIEEKGKA